jgi:hypothetical protein
MQEGGMEVEALKNRPQITMWTQEYWQAFQILSGSRIVHQGGVGPIPLSEMVAYMNAMYITDADERLTFITMIQSLDKVYTQHINHKAKQDRERQSKLQKATKPKRRR